jgi:hypothetical protein
MREYDVLGTRRNERLHVRLQNASRMRELLRLVYERGR